MSMLIIGCYEESDRTSIHFEQTQQRLIGLGRLQDLDTSMETEPWHPGGEDGVPETWKEGEGPPPFTEEGEEPEIPDPNMEGMPTIWGYEDCDFDKTWHPGGEDGVPETWKEGEGPPPFTEEGEEPEIPDPNMEGMPTIWGYEDCDFDKKKKARPPLEHHKSVAELLPVEIKSVEVVGEDECRRIITEHVQSDCCLGKEPINTMIINNVKPSNAYRYTLESFVEKRKVGYEYKPYKGGEIDDPSHGRAPESWEMKVKVKEFFKDDHEKEEVPHTSSVRTCHHCIGLGYVRCHVCKGWCSHVCRQCSGFTSMVEGGEGAEGVAMCSACNDTHHESCVRCGGDGRIACPACDGYRAIRCFIQLKVKFKTYKEEYVKEDTALPDHLIKETKGVTVFEQTHEKVYSYLSYPALYNSQLFIMAWVLWSSAVFEVLSQNTVPHLTPQT
ncbi:hypothetical protein ACOMHN_047723 [Nucella lapillus]